MLQQHACTSPRQAAGITPRTLLLASGVLTSVVMTPCAVLRSIAGTAYFVSQHLFFFNRCCCCCCMLQVW
jgi:hypothetical protein